MRARFLDQRQVSPAFQTLAEFLGAGSEVLRGKSTAPKVPRARKATKPTVEGDQLVLQCTGDDPGLAFSDLNLTAPPACSNSNSKATPPAPQNCSGTLPPQTVLPKGKHLEFTVQHDCEWREHSISIDETKTLHALRLDPCGGVGEVKIEGLALKAADGKVLAK